MDYFQKPNTQNDLHGLFASGYKVGIYGSSFDPITMFTYRQLPLIKEGIKRWLPGKLAGNNSAVGDKG